MQTEPQSAPTMQPEYNEGCTAITARTGVLKPCGLRVERDGLCKEHLERKSARGV